jgi:ABC-2 type transport system permease protein
VPPDQLGHVFEQIAKFAPTFGVGVLTRYPLIHAGSLGLAVVNVLAWLTVFTTGAIWRFRKDTARV